MRLALWLFSLSLAAQPERVFDRVWETIQRGYYDPRFNGADWQGARQRYRAEAAAAVSDDALYGVLNRMLAELKDRHTAATPPAVVAQQRRRSMNKLGFGLQLVEGKWVVKSVDPQSDLYASGITPGWILERMGSQPLPPSLAEMRQFDIKTGYRERCDAGDPFSLRLRDIDDSTRDVNLRCKPIAISPRHEASRFEGDTLYLRFDEFAPTSGKWFAAQLRPAPRALIVDLRENNGGLLDALQEMLPYLFRNRFAFGAMKTRSGRETNRSLNGKGGRAFQGPVAVLIGANTASASEIFAAVVKESGRGTVYGEASPGIVLFSVRDGLPGGGELQYSVWDYETPKGNRLEGRGVTPDVAITPTLADLRRRRDPVLERAIHDLQVGR